MKAQFNHPTNRMRKGFTMVELMVSTGITILIISMIVTITSIALGAWRDGRSEVRASRQAKALLDVLGRDLESMVIRSGNNFEWFTSEAQNNIEESPNAATLIFFTAATDRYDGNIGGAADNGGDVSTVGYQLAFQDPVNPTGSSAQFSTYVMYRQLVNPDVTFADYLAKTDLKSEFGSVSTGNENFICENIYELSVTFVIAYRDGSVEKQVRVPLIGTNEFNIKGSGLEITGFSPPAGTTIAQLQGGRLISADLGITVLTDHGLGVLKAANFNATQKAEFVAANSFRYSKTVTLPQP